MDPMTLQAIQTVGFPIVIALMILGFLFTIIKWMMKKADEQYKDHRTDIVLLSEINSKNLNKVTTLFEGQLQKRDQRDEVLMSTQKGILDRLDNLNDGQLKILEYIDKKTKK